MGQMLSAVLGAPIRFIKHRRLMSTMAQMSDYELKDIGLIRPDVSDATALPLGSDIGSFLSVRARERSRSSMRRP